MGRNWDRAHPALDFVLPCAPRSKAHESEWRRKESFIRYWSTRYAMAYDIADQHATAIIWTLPRTSHQTAEALERGGWSIKDNLVHLFGTGWMKSKRTNEDGERVPNALAPGYEHWILATKGKPDLDIDACRVPRGERTLNGRAEWDSSGQSYGTRKGSVVLGKTSEGSLPKNALLSHCEECVRVGVKRVKGDSHVSHDSGTALGRMNDDSWKAKPRTFQHYGTDGTESVQAWHCLAGCVCGARSKWDPEKPLPTCPCGEAWRWLCAVAEVNAQSGNRPSGGGNKASSAHGAVYSPKDDIAPRLYEKNGGGGARFFNTFSYLSKCASGERHAGCENLFWRANKKNPFGFDQVTREEWEALPFDERAQGNVHPTVKPYRLMHWLHSLTGAKRIVDLCAGSGSGMITAAIDGSEWTGAEICPEAVIITKARHAFWAGLSHEARRAMVEDDEVPTTASVDERQLALF